MTVLFLDFDGVLHPDAGTEVVLLEKKPLLWQILRACPHVQVVFSTSWRKTRNTDELIQLVTVGGGEGLAHRFIGANPVLDHGGETYRHREQECLAWLQENEQRFPIAERPVSWLALDDVARWFSLPCWSLHLVDFRTGLTAADVKAVTSKLQALP